MRTVTLLLILVMGLGCGDSPLTIDVDLAVNQSGNPLIDISEDPTSPRIFFQFTPLRCGTAGSTWHPTSIGDADVNLPVITWPSGAGAGPLVEQYNIDTTTLRPRTYYQVQMIAKRPNGQLTHNGVGDCPINLALGGRNHSTICFGPASMAPTALLCPDSVPFEQCPGVSTQECFE